MRMRISLCLYSWRECLISVCLESDDDVLSPVSVNHDVNSLSVIIGVVVVGAAVVT